nr:small VCP/p97-interacting protein isoform X2 [Misgurnus anguillicaudatus]
MWCYLCVDISPTSQTVASRLAEFLKACGQLDVSMGMCLPCLSGAEDEVVVTPDPETRRRQLAEAAEKRQKERLMANGRPKAARRHTEASKIQKPWTGKRRNRKKWRKRP